MKSCGSTRFRLRRELSVRKNEAGSITIGYYPPVAKLIEQEPAFLASLLAFISSPRTLLELRDEFAATDQNLLDMVLADLIALGLIEQAKPEHRFDRHAMYYRLLGEVPDRAQQVLASKHIGIIGTGGIGSTAAMLLAAAGVGTITLSDGDKLEESNLTRSILFDEEDLGAAKVWAAQSKLTARNSGVTIHCVPREINGVEFVRTHFASCDMLILSADRPAAVHEWVDTASATLGIPYLTAGYVELFGSVGPLIIPGKTGCLKCAVLNGNERSLNETEINIAHQAASYGPLNAAVSALAANESIRFLLDLPARSLGTQLLINSTNYEMHENPFSPNLGCSCGAAAHLINTSTAPTPHQAFDHDDPFAEISKIYDTERDELSLNALILDDLVVRLATGKPQLRILDMACGTGTIAVRLAALGHAVTAVDSSQSMLQGLRRSLMTTIAPERVQITCAAAETFATEERYDCVILNMALDHIGDADGVLKKLKGLLAHGGTMILSVPHPFKDSGRWQKMWDGQRWRYGEFIVADYFREGPQSKTREAADGTLLLNNVISQKRTLGTYFSLLHGAGLQVSSVYEPALPSQASTDSDANHAKAARIPYFLVFVCEKAEADIPMEQ